MKKIFYSILLFLCAISSVSALNVNVSINYAQSIKTLQANTWGFNNHLDYTGYPTYLDNNSDGTIETISNVSYHRTKAVQAGVEIWRGDARLSSKYAGINQGILDSTTLNSTVTGNGSNTNITGWNLSYANINYGLQWFSQPNDGTIVDVLNFSGVRFDPGRNIIVFNNGADLGVGKANISQTILAEANNGSAFNIHATLYNGIAAISPNLTTDATCLGSYTNNISGVPGSGWRQYSLYNCTKTANTTIRVTVTLTSFPLTAYQAVGSVYVEYDRTQEPLIGWRQDSNNFVNINSDYDFLSWAYNETALGRPTKAVITIFHMPQEIANMTTGCDSDSRGCSFSDNLTYSGMIKSYLRRITNNGQFCSAIDSIEIWNEPDLDDYWLDDITEGVNYRYEEYNRLYNVSWYAIKSSVCGSGTKVSGPGLASIITTSGDDFINSWLGNFTTTLQYDKVTHHRYPTSSATNLADAAKSLEGTLNTTRTLYSTYNVNTSRVCTQINELNENNQNLVQNYTTAVASSYNAMMATIANDNLCLQLMWYQWADDSPWGTSRSEGNSSGTFRIALQEPLNGGEVLYSSYNASRAFFKNMSGSSVIYNNTDNDTGVYVVSGENNLSKRFGIINTNNASVDFSVYIVNVTAFNFVSDNGTLYNLTGGTVRNANVTGLAPFSTTWFTLNTTTITISNGTCFVTDYVNWCFNTDVYLYNNVTVSNTSLNLDDYVFNVTTTTGYANVSIDSWDIYGNNSMRIKSLTASNIVTSKFSTNLINYSTVYGSTLYSYGNSFIASTSFDTYYYTTAVSPNNEWFVNATNNVTGLLVPIWNITGDGVTHSTNNGSMLFNGLHDSSGYGNTLIKGDCTVSSSYIDCYDPNSTAKIGATNTVLNSNSSWSIGLWYQSYDISLNGTPDTILFLARDNGATGNNSAVTIRTQNVSRLVMTFRNGSNTTETFDLGTVSTGRWYHVGVTYNGSNLLGYFNGINTVNQTRTFFGFGSNNATLAGLGDGEKFSGSIAQIALYNTSISYTDVNNLLFNGTPLYTGLRAYYPFKLFAIPTANVNASSTGYVGVSGVFSTTTPKTFVLGQLFTFTNFTVEEIVSLRTLTNYTLTINGTDNVNYFVTGSSFIANLSYGSYNYTINKSGYYVYRGSFTASNNSRSVNTTGLFSLYLNITFGNSILNINETNFSASAYSTVYGVTINGTTTNGTVVLKWYNDTSTVLTAYDGVNTSRTNLSTRTDNATSPAILRYRLVGVLANSVYFSFFDENTQLLLNGTNVTVYVTSDNYTFNFTEVSGNRTVNNVPAGTYIVTALAPLYSQRTYTFVLETGSAQEQVIFLLNNNSGTYIRFTVLDQSYNVLQEATINAVRKNISGTNYYEVGDCTTDNNGECLIYLQTLTATYRFVACYDSTCYTTPDTTLSRDTYSLVINLASSGLSTLFQDRQVQKSLTYSNGNFTYTMTDTNNIQRVSRVTVSRINGGRETLLQSISGTGTTIVLTSTYENVSIGDGLVARSYITVNGQEVLGDVITAVPNNLSTGRNASLLLLFVGLVITMVLIFSWNPVVPPIVFGVLLLIFQRIGLVQIGVEIVAAVFVIIAVAIYRMRNI